MPFKVKGNSGYRLKRDNNLVVKYAEQYDERLIKSAQKQKEFKSNYFKTPQVYDITNSSFTMEYINGDSFIDFFTRASKRDLDGLILKLDNYFKERIVGQYNLPMDVIKEKLISIPNATHLLEYVDKFDYINIKIGKCHGDLTFSNMVFAEDVYLIDFLDSYIESPTMDIVKLRQDTQLYWSLNMVDKVKDEIKIKLGLNYIDKWITNTFDIEHYNLLQTINLYRIYPYTNNPLILEYLNQNINKLCEHF